MDPRCLRSSKVVASIQGRYESLVQRMRSPSRRQITALPSRCAQTETMPGVEFQPNKCSSSLCSLIAPDILLFTSETYVPIIPYRSYHRKRPYIRAFSCSEPARVQEAQRPCRGAGCPRTTPFPAFCPSPQAVHWSMKKHPGRPRGSHPPIDGSCGPPSRSLGVARISRAADWQRSHQLRCRCPMHRRRSVHCHRCYP
jgi:hypothetical protein